MTTANAGAKGMLSKEAARKSFFANLVDLYKSDLAFRGMTDFAIIGAIALMFLDPLHKVVWPWSGPGGETSAQPSASGGFQGLTAPALGPAAAPTPAPAPVAPAVPIPFADWLKDPRLDPGFLFDIDGKAFASSSEADRPRLEAARKSFVLRHANALIEELRQADGNDPNVALLRGAAFAMRQTEEDNRTAESLWRQAASGGSTQAKALLGALLVSGSPGVTKNVAEGRELIEAGVAAGDPQAQRLAAIGYLSGDLGMLDAPKAATLLKQAADSGDAMAMGIYARLLASGIGVAGADGKQAEQYLRKAADAGLTSAQLTLGEWLINQYAKGLIADPKEAVDWLDTAYEKGHALPALISLAYLQESVAKGPPWKDVSRAMSYIRKCSGFAFAVCQFNTAVGWQYGYFGKNDLIRARAHYGIAQSLGYRPAAERVKAIGASLSASQIAQAEAEEKSIASKLKGMPPLIPLQEAGISSPPPEAVIDSLAGFQPALQPSASQAPSPSGKPASNAPPVNPKVQALRERAQQHMKDKDFDSAIADFTDIIRQGDGNWEDYNQRGMAYHFKRQLASAADDYSRAIAHDAHAAPAYFNRALVYSDQGEIDKALSDLNAAIREDASWPAYFLSRGDMYFRKRDYNSALKDYDTYVELIQKDPAATKDNKAEAYLMRGKARAQIAMAEGDACKRMIPPDPSCNEGTKFKPAVLDFEQALLAKPDLAEAHFQMGWIADSTGDKRKAIESYTYALKSDPNNSTAYNNRGVIYGDMGQKDLALADYNDAIRVDPNNKFAWANRGALYGSIRRKRNEAIADFRRALQIDPSYDYAVRGLKKLGAKP